MILAPLGIFLVYLFMGYTVLMGAFYATIGALLEITVGILTAALGVVMIDICIVGYLRHPVSMPLRLLMLAGGVMMVIPSYLLSVIGLAVGGAAFLMARKAGTAAETR